MLLASPGFIRNDGGILGASRIDIFDQSAKRKVASVIDAGEIDATRGNGAYIQGAGTVRNQGFIIATKTGIAITMQPPAQMAFLAPAARPAAAILGLPSYAAPAAAPFAPASLPTAASAGWLAQNLVTASAHFRANHVTFNS